MRSAGLTESQFGALEALSPPRSPVPAGACRQGAQERRQHDDRVDNLEKRGLVERRRDGDDRRIVTVHLTKVGEKLVREVFPRVVDALVSAFSVLSAKDQEQLAALCRRLGTAES